MAVKRIVATIEPGAVDAARPFYGDILGLDVLMDHGWIATYGSHAVAAAQISFASEGGSGAPTPALSIEVDDLDATLAAMRRAGVAIEYGPADEPWGRAPLLRARSLRPAGEHPGASGRPRRGCAVMLWRRGDEKGPVRQAAGAGIRP